MLDRLQLSQFTPLVGETFRISADGGAVDAELLQANACGPASTRAPRRAFSLLFRIPADAQLPQRMYRVEHQELSVDKLFMVPVQPDGQGNRLEAIFN